jgi:uncharacterized repeat protein (TIGR03803 family)
MVGADKGEPVTNRPQRITSKAGLGAASIALLFAAVLGFAIASTQSANAQTFTVLYKFNGSAGANPYGNVVLDGSGNIYSTTANGGSFNKGVVFKLDSAGTETVLHNFNGTRGSLPLAGLLRNTDGALFGTTWSGGSSGEGVVFKLSKSGGETILHTFAGGTMDGASPWGGLIQDSDGNSYGTTNAGGTSNWGTVFKISKSGVETVLHSFNGGQSDGEFPYYTNLVRDSEGNLYGITSAGGGDNRGVVYKLNKSGKLTVLHSFLGGTNDGCTPYGTPVMDADGNLYGTTYKCGSANEGVIWKLAKNGKETVLHNFTGGSSDGAYPYAGVIMDAKGNFYGDTAYGGSSNDGTVFELNNKGKLKVLHSFDGTDGASPIGGLIQDSKGTLYGTAYAGSAGNYGTVWKLTP